jgi:hypothetical protein
LEFETGLPGVVRGKEGLEFEIGLPRVVRGKEG